MQSFLRMRLTLVCPGNPGLQKPLRQRAKKRAVGPSQGRAPRRRRSMPGPRTFRQGRGCSRYAQHSRKRRYCGHQARRVDQPHESRRRQPNAAARTTSTRSGRLGIVLVCESDCSSLASSSSSVGPTSDSAASGSRSIADRTGRILGGGCLLSHKRIRRGLPSSSTCPRRRTRHRPQEHPPRKFSG